MDANDPRGWREDARGYRIAVFRIGERCRWCAYAPPLDAAAQAARLRPAYRRGEHVPQQREALGCFDDFEGARLACDKHNLGVKP